MKSWIRNTVAGLVALGASGLIGGVASATTPTLTLTSPTTAAINGAPFTLTATASEAGSVAFSAGGTTITGCAAEMTVQSGTNFVALCPWTPSLTQTSPVTIGATLTATVVADGTATASTVNVNVTPIALSGAAVYVGKDAKITAVTYSPGAVEFMMGGSDLSGCAAKSVVLAGNNTSYTTSCTITAAQSGGTVTGIFTPTTGANNAGQATYKLAVNSVVMSGGANAVVGVATTLTASTYTTGNVEFKAGGTDISGCASVATTGAAVPYSATCSYTPASAGATTISATLTPTSGSPVTAPDYTVTAGNLVLTGGAAIYTVSPGTIVANAYAAGAVSFFTVVNAANVAIDGCANVATTGTSAPFTATCTWTPSAAGPAVLTATITGTGIPANTNSNNLSVTVGTPIQGSQWPISMYVDTIVASGGTGVLAPTVGAGCAITNEFFVGQTIVWRVYGNDFQNNGAPLTPSNVTSATITIPGYTSSPITMTFGSHGGQAFWTGVLKTGTTGSLYNTLGIIPYVVTMQTATVPAVPAVTKQVPVYGTRGVYAKDKKGKWQPVMIKVNGKMVQKTEQYVVKYNTVIVTPAKAAIPGATGTFNSAFNPNSILTLNAVPTVFK